MPHFDHFPRPGEIEACVLPIEDNVKMGTALVAALIQHGCRVIDLGRSCEKNS